MVKWAMGLLALVCITLTLSSVSRVEAHPAKPINTDDADVVAIADWLAGELSKNDNITNEVVQIFDAQRQLVNGNNYFLVLLMKESTSNVTEWILHKAQIYEHPPWDASAENKYEVTIDEVPTFEAVLETSREHLLDTAKGALAAKVNGEIESVNAAETLQQLTTAEYFSLETGKRVENIVSYRFQGDFKDSIESKVSTYDVTIVTKNEQVVFTNFEFIAEVTLLPENDRNNDDFPEKNQEDKSASNGVGDSTHSEVASVKAAKTSIIALTLVGVIALMIFTVHRLRVNRSKKTKEEWYIEQLTDIDEL